MKYISAELSTAEKITADDIFGKVQNYMSYISDMCFDDGRLSGVYVLFYNERIVYIGKTKDIASRLNQHRKHGRMFEDWAFLPIPDTDTEEMDYIEQKLVAHCCPEQNRHLFDNGRGGSTHCVTAIENATKAEVDRIRDEFQQELSDYGLGDWAARGAAKSLTSKFLSWLEHKELDEPDILLEDPDREAA